MTPMETIKSILELARGIGFKGNIDVEAKEDLCLNTLRMTVPNGILRLQYHVMLTPDGKLIGNIWLNFMSNNILYDRPLVSLYNGYATRNVGPKVFADLLKHLDMIKSFLNKGEDTEDVAIEKWINNSTFELLEG